MLHPSSTEWIFIRGGYTVLACVALFGSLANFSLFFVTLRTKSLRFTCHLLIGLCALLDGLHQIGQLFQAPFIFSYGLMDSFTCSALQLLPEIGLLGGCACVLSIGFERLTAVVFLAQYRGRGRRNLAWLAARGLYSLLAVISFVGSLANFSLFFVTLRSKMLRSTCHLLIGLCALLDGLHQVGQFFQFPVLFGDGAIDSFLCAVLQVLPEIGVLGGCACLLSIGLERLTAVVFIQSYRKLLSQRLVCAIPAPFHGGAMALWSKALGSLNVATILVYSTVAIVLSRRTDEETRFILRCACGLFINAGIGAKAFIYVSTSSEYRKAYHFVLGQYVRLSGSKVSTTASATITTHVSTI